MIVWIKSFFLIGTILLIFNSFNNVNCSANSYVQEYYQQRQELVDEDQYLAIGSKVDFNQQEEKANEIFLSILQSDELSLSNQDPPSLNALTEKDTIESLTTFKILQKLPKGAALHLHQDSTGSYDYLIQVGTYLPNCYFYTSNNNPTTTYGAYYFFAEQPSDTAWVLIETIRSQQLNVTQFDMELYYNLTLVGKDFGDYVELWRNFDKIFNAVAGLTSYIPIAEGYLQHIIDQLIADNIQHVELRKPFAVYYDTNGTSYDDAWYMELVQDLVTKARKTYDLPCFNIKIIGADYRHSNTSLVMEHLILSLNLRNQYPNTFIGYDLDGPEDLGYPLLYYIDQFAQILEVYRNSSYEYQLDYFFHAGESILYNNTNLYDAILLNSRRIGHGFSIEKFPVLLQILIEKNIGLEICAISNQILGFYTNIRSHPVTSLLNQGVAVTISSDDPAIYNIVGTSYDFFEVVFSNGLDLKQVKQLCLNSLDQSIFYDNEESDSNYQQWEQSWYSFIDYIISTYGSNSNSN